MTMPKGHKTNIPLPSEVERPETFPFTETLKLIKFFQKSQMCGISSMFNTFKC